MKKLILLVVFIVVFCKGFSQHHQFSITWSYAIAGGNTPATAPILYADALTPQQASDLVKDLIDNSKLDFKCIYNGCQNRAMVMSLLLQKKGIKHYKIWNFEPSKISLFNAMDLLDVDDVLKLKKSRITWGFHVALSVLVQKADGTMDTLVIDPSFSNQPLTVASWLGLQNSPGSYYTFLDPEWYNFVTLPTASYTCDGTTINFQKCFPQLITGDFYKYNDTSKNLLIAEMATNEQITRVATELIYKLSDSDPSYAKLTGTVSDNFSYFMSILQGNVTLPASDPFAKHVKHYMAAYNKSVSYWTTQLQ